MSKLVEVYPKLGCLTDSDPTGFAWTVAARNAVKVRIQGIADGFPGVSVDSWHLHTDEGTVEGLTIQSPKAVVRLTVPNSVTHADIVQSFIDDGFWAWAKNGVRNLLPPGVAVFRWRGKLMTSLGHSTINETGP